jgi:hypothetical protein
MCSQKFGTWKQVAEFFQYQTTLDRILDDEQYIVRINQREQCYEIIEVKATDNLTLNGETVNV